MKQQRQKAARRARRPRVPRLCLHAPSGQGRVRLSGRDHYCGVFGTAGCAQRYAELVRAWEERGRGPLDQVPVAGSRIRGLLVRELFEQYEEWVDDSGLYRKGGAETSQRVLIRVAVRELSATLGHLPVVRFTKGHLVRHRDKLVAGGRLTRTSVNRKISLVRQVFAWGNERDLVPDVVLGSLRALSALKRGQTSKARDPQRRQPATRQQIDAILPSLQPAVAAMLELQSLTSMRPGEVCIMRWADIDETPVVVDGVPCWTYWPHASKTEHRGVRTCYPLPPGAQQILERFRKLPGAYIFSPRDAMLELGRKRRSARETPPTKQMEDRDAAPGREFEERYTTFVYRQAVERACKRAKVPVFTPHAVRHGVLTQVANHPSLGFGAAGALANHLSPNSTRVYVHQDRMLAYRAAVLLDRAASG